MGFGVKSLSMAAHPTALITGASRGLGKCLATNLWDSGYNLILVARDATTLNKLSIELNKSLSINQTLDQQHRAITIYTCDLANISDIDKLVKTLFINHSSLDVLINNAAIQGPIGKSHDIWTTKPDSFREAIQVDLLAPIELASRLVPLMVKNDPATAQYPSSIINLSGGGATGPRPNFSAYATAKTGLVRFTEILAEEVKELGIRVNCIAPGAMKTSMMQEILSKDRRIAGAKEYSTAQKVLADGGSSMQRVAQLVMYLIGARSEFITGRLISASWDNWESLHEHGGKLSLSDLFTLRRITGRDRGHPWADAR